MYQRRTRRTLRDELEGWVESYLARPQRPPRFAWDWGMRRARRQRWTPEKVILAAVLGVLALGLAVTLLALAVAGLLLAAPAYLGYRIVRAHLRQRRRAPSRRGRDAHQMARDARGLLEMARTADPLDRYLLAVREFDRISAGMLAIDPVDLSQRRTARRAADLTEQAYNLYDAVAEIERQLAGDRRAAGALSSIWELSVATGELASYCRDLGAAPGSPTLAELRGFTARRATLLDRRDALVSRLADVKFAPGDAPKQALGSSSTARIL